MKVILTQDVRGQGKRGQMIEVSDGYARNFLLPRKLAQEATADNINTMRMNDKATQERQAKERAEALELRNRMKDMTVVVTAKGGGAGRLFGSVTNTEVSEALATEDASGQAAQTYAHIVAVRKEDKDSEKTKVLVDALKTDDVKKFIEDEYKDAVVAIF